MEKFQADVDSEYSSLFSSVDHGRVGSYFCFSSIWFCAHEFDYWPIFKAGLTKSKFYYL